MYDPQEGSDVSQTDEELVAAAQGNFEAGDMVLPIESIGEAVLAGTIDPDKKCIIRAADASDWLRAWRQLQGDMAVLESKHVKAQGEYSALLTAYNEVKAEKDDLHTDRLRLSSLYKEANVRIESLERILASVEKPRHFEPVKIRTAGVIVTVEADNV